MLNSVALRETYISSTLQTPEWNENHIKRVYVGYFMIVNGQSIKK